MLVMCISHTFFNLFIFLRFMLIFFIVFASLFVVLEFLLLIGTYYSMIYLLVCFYCCRGPQIHVFGSIIVVVVVVLALLPHFLFYLANNDSLATSMTIISRRLSFVCYKNHV
jgi:hypothetical protein